MSKKEILRIIDTLLEEELKGFGNQSKMDSATREAFVAARVRPSAITVNFSGGITKICWNVTSQARPLDDILHRFNFRTYPCPRNERCEFE